MLNKIEEDLTMFSLDHTDKFREFAKLYQQISLPEMELVDYPKEGLLEKISAFNTLIADISAHDVADETLKSLKEQIGKDIDLYHYFAKATVEELNSILDSDFAEEEEVMNSQSITCFHRGPLLASPIDFDDVETGIISTQDLLSVRHTDSKRSIMTNATNLAIQSPQDDSMITPAPTSIFKWTVLKKLSSHAHTMSPQFGRITCFDVSVGIALGTESSAILFYSLKQEFKSVIGGAEDNFGAATCLKLLGDGENLLVGYENGYVCLWDLKKCSKVIVIEPLKNSTKDKDGHECGVPIVSVSITSPDKFYSADREGSAFFHSLNFRILYTSVTSIRIHGESMTSNCTNRTTILSFKALGISSLVTLKVDRFKLVAIASPFKVAILSIAPYPKLQFRATWDELGFADFVESKVNCAVVSWWRPESTKQALNPILAVSFGNRVALIRVDCDIKDRSKLCFEVYARSKLVFTVVGLEWLDSQYILCKSSNDLFSILNSKDLALVEKGSFVIGTEPKMAALSDRRLKNNLCIYSNRLFAYSNEFASATLIPWTERLAILFETGHFQEALKEGVNIYNNNNSIAAMEIPSGAKQRREVTSSYLTELILKLVSMNIFDFDKGNTDQSSFLSTTIMVLQTCLEIKRQSLMYDEIWGKYVEAGLTNTFLKALSDIILSGSLKAIPTHIVTAIFESSDLDLSSLEQVLLNLDVSSLDIDYILLQCRRMHLSSAMIYTYSQGLNDFTSPITEIVNNCKAEKNPQECLQDLYILFVYISYGLTGRSFPLGLKDVENEFQTFFAILSLILNKSVDNFKEEYPFLDFLVKADASKTSAILFHALESECLNSKTSFEGVILIDRQIAVECVLSLLSQGFWDRYQLDQMYSFVAKSAANFRESIILEESMITTIFDTLLRSGLENTFAVRQDALLAMFKAELLVFINEEHLISLAEMGFWRIYEMVAIRSGNYQAAIESYMKDATSLASDAIDAIENWLNMPNLDVQYTTQIKTTTINYTLQLAQDCSRFAALINNYWPEEHKIVLSILTAAPLLRFKYIDRLLDFNVVTLPIDQLHQMHVELYLVQQPGNAIEYLQSFAPCDLPVSLDFILNISEKHDIILGKVFAHSRKGNLMEAAVLLVEKTKQTLLNFDKYSESHIDSIIKICRSSKKQQDRLDIWNFVLDSLCFQIGAQPTTKSAKVREILINTAIEDVSIPNILIRLLEVESSAKFGTHRQLILSLLHRFTQERDTHEQAANLSRQSQFDAFEILNRSIKSSYFPIPGQCQICSKLFHLRAMTLVEQKENLIIFHCHHAFHATCLEREIEKAHVETKQPGSVDEYEIWCYICGIPSTKRKKGKSKMFFASMPDVSSGTGESARQLLTNFETISEYLYPKTDFISQLKSSKPQTYTPEDFDEIYLNDEDQ